MTTRNDPYTPPPIKLDEWDPNDPFGKIVSRRKPAIRAWAEKQPPDQLAEQFTEVLSLLLLERNLRRRREEMFQTALHQYWTEPDTPASEGVDK